jgi:HD-GYP domain-containing protein (c-di-GMP phosphodiesterase class II)
MRSTNTEMKKHPLRSSLNNFFTFWKPSLSRRLTISFTVFGLVIGYAVLIFLAVSATNSFINMTSNVVQQRISSLSEGDGSNRGYELFELLELIRRDLGSSAKGLHGILSEVTLNLYVRDNGRWQHIYLDTQGVIQSQKITDLILTRELEKAGESKVLTSSQLFLGAEDKVNAKLNITQKEGRQTYILSFDIYRLGILKILQDNIYKSLIFFMGLLLISRALGYLFSIRLARPIEQLAREATVIASGQYENRFTTGRKDEIGTLADALNNMASRIIDGTRERENLLIGILIALTRSIDAKSPWTAGHSERVTRLAEAIGHSLHLNDEQMRILNISAILHDIGKIAVPEQVLDKPEKLTDEEFAVVRKHPRAGADILSSIPSYETILPGILHHHERWDGTGYPTGAGGTDIPLAARIICIADVYDALTADRPYRKAWSKEQTMRFFDEQKGKMFDPELVSVFQKLVTKDEALSGFVKKERT